MNEKEEFSMKALQEHCDKLTKGGKKLSVIWNSEDDFGWPKLMLEGIEIVDPDPVEKQILQAVETSLGYETNREDITTEGEVVYDSLNKCFAGIDNYTLVNYDGKLKYFIVICIQHTILFERLIVRITTGEQKDIDVHIDLVPDNNQRSDAFEELVSIIEKQLVKEVSASTAVIPNFCSINYTRDIPRFDFWIAPGKRCFTIDELPYHYRCPKSKKVYIPMVDRSAS